MSLCQELEDRNAELEEELKFLRAKMLKSGSRASVSSRVALSSSSAAAEKEAEDSVCAECHGVIPVPTVVLMLLQPHRVRDQIANFKNSLDEVERLLDALPANKTSKNLTSGESKSVHEWSIT